MMMTICIGDIDDPEWSWEATGDRWNGNLPKWLTSALPDPTDFAPGWAIIRGIRNGKYQGGQIDWGSWAVKMRPKDILAFIDEHYGSGPSDTDPARRLAWYERVKEVRRAVQALEPSKLYGLVAYEEA
jgi:hypothetical protein